MTFTDAVWTKQNDVLARSIDANPVSSWSCFLGAPVSNLKSYSSKRLMIGNPANFNKICRVRCSLASNSTLSNCSRKSAKVLSVPAAVSAIAYHSTASVFSLRVSQACCIMSVFKFIPHHLNRLVIKTQRMLEAYNEQCVIGYCRDCIVGYRLFW